MGCAKSHPAAALPRDGCHPNQTSYTNSSKSATPYARYCEGDDRQPFRHANHFRLAGFCHLNQIEPEYVCNATLAVWRAKGASRRQMRGPVKEWNDHSGSTVVPVPSRHLTLPDGDVRKPEFPDLDHPQYPPSLIETWRSYAAAQAIEKSLAELIPDEDEFSDIEEDEDEDEDEESPSRREPQKLKDSSIKLHYQAAKYAAAAAVRAQILRPEAIASVDMLLDTKIMKATLNMVRKRQKERDPSYPDRNATRHGKAISLVSMAIRLGRPPKSIKRMRQIARRVDPNILVERGKGSTRRELKIGPRSAKRLEAFNFAAAWIEWFTVPAKLVSRAENNRCRRRAGVPTQRDMSDMIVAIPTVILQQAPVRRANVAETRMKPDLRANLILPTTAGDLAVFRFFPDEVKNRVSINAELDGEAVALIKLWLAAYRPHYAKLVGSAKDNVHLFPGPGLKSKHPTGLGQVFRQKFEDVGHITVTMHLARHLSARVILDDDPNQIHLVQEILAHKKLETTKAYYAHLREVAARRKYREILGARVRELKLRHGRLFGAKSVAHAA